MSAIARILLKLSGWRLVGQLPDAQRGVAIFAPHTSNWDFLLLLGVKLAFGRPFFYLAKHTLFRPPFAWFFRWTGGVPVERGRSHHLVEEITEHFKSRDYFWLAISPEGTRQKTDHWKSGFYRIALAAGVPLLLVFIDNTRKECGVGPLLQLSGDVDRDLAQIREFYVQKRGIYPQFESDICFKPESRGPGAPA